LAAITLLDMIEGGRAVDEVDDVVQEGVSEACREWDPEA